MRWLSFIAMMGSNALRHMQTGLCSKKEIIALLTYNSNKTYRTWAWTLVWLGLVSG